MNTKLHNLAQKVGLILKNKGLTIVTAESCTGGSLSASITEIPGSSTCFECGFIVYSNQSKQNLLDVKKSTLEKFGAVSEEIAKEMAEGALKHSNADIGVAITGIAGPDGATLNKPIGTVCFAIISKNSPPKTFTEHFKGDRNSIRIKATEFALQNLIKRLS